MSCSINKLKYKMLFTCKNLCFPILHGKQMHNIAKVRPLPLLPALQDLLSAPSLAPSPHPIGSVLFWHFWPSFYPI